MVRQKNDLRKKMRSGQSTAKVRAKSQRTKEIWLWGYKKISVHFARGLDRKRFISSGLSNPLAQKK